MKNKCIACSKEDLDKNTIALNIKLLGRSIESYYCLDCLADYLGVTIDELLEKIEEFKNEGCKLFS